MSPSASDPALVSRIASELGVEDLFVLRRVEADRFVHLGGAGRGEGWAGLIELRLGTCPPAARAYSQGMPASVSGDQVRHVFGPYYARSAVFVALDRDVLVVVGNPDGRLPHCGGDALMTMVSRAGRAVDKVSPAKRLADELELLHALKNLLIADPATPAEAMQHVLDCTLEALSCELGVLWLPGAGRAMVRARGWPFTGSADDAGAALSVSDEGPGDPVCVQDARTAPLPRPLHPDDGVRSYLRLPVGELGAMVVMHTEADPRGFSTLCQEVGRRLSQASEVVLRAALRHEHLERELGRASQEARRDPLTGVANRLAWEEAVQAAMEGARKPPLGVIIVDVDELKDTNDRHGHQAGDALLRTVAGILESHVRPSDVLARIGGDEFAILLPGADETTSEAVVQRLRESAATHAGADGAPISFAYGMAVCEHGPDLLRAIASADSAMYRLKEARRQPRAS